VLKITKKVLLHLFKKKKGGKSPLPGTNRKLEIISTKFQAPNSRPPGFKKQEPRIKNQETRNKIKE
jgi:hypothetical protein